jgi:hypothetical protein
MTRYLLSLLLIGGCAAERDLGPVRPAIDVSPLGCDYKWFQSGYSPTIRVPCESDRSGLAEHNVQLASDHAWEIARQRCPSECGPIELQDSIDSTAAEPQGVCRNGYAYFSTRVFFQCRR